MSRTIRLITHATIIGGFVITTGCGVIKSQPSLHSENSPQTTTCSIVSKPASSLHSDVKTAVDQSLRKEGDNAFRLDGAAQPSPILIAQEQEDRCKEWQHRDSDGDCVDNRDVHHFEGHHEPAHGEQCWVVTKCLCQQGQFPSSQSCSPCSYVGEETICVRR